MKTIYTAHAVATRAGRNGNVKTPTQTLDLDLRVPKEMGGPGGGTNPEELFAAGYAACFHSALQLVAQRQKAALGESSVEAQVGIGPNDSQGFELEVTLVVNIPEQPQAAAEELAAKAHQVCPYSNATRGNITVSLNVVGAN